MASLTTELENRLKEGGWSKIRQGRHNIWQHPNGAIHTISTTMRDVGVDRKRAFREIAHKEVDPQRCSRVPRIIIQEPTMPSHPLPTTPVLPAVSAILETSGPTKPTENDKWYVCMRRWREHRRIKRHELAKGMVPFLWTSATVKAVEVGGSGISEEEMDQWKLATKCGDFMDALEIPYISTPTYRQPPAVKVGPPSVTLVAEQPSTPQVNPTPVLEKAPAPELKKQPLMTGAEIRETRIAIGATQQAVAKAALIPQSRLSRVESGQTEFSPAEFDRWFDTINTLGQPALVPTEAADGPVDECSSAHPVVEALDTRRLTALVLGDTTTRAVSIAALVRILNNPRLTDDEVVKFASDGCTSLARTLLFG